MNNPKIFSLSTLFYSQHGSYTSRLANKSVIDLTNFIVCSEREFKKRFAKPDSSLGPYNVDKSAAIRQLSLPAEKPILQREARNRDYLVNHANVWGETPDAIIMSQQCRLSGEIKSLFPVPPLLILYAEYFVPSDIAARKEWPLHESMQRSMDRWKEKSMIDGSYADAIIVPTHFAKSFWPEHFHQKINVIFDGVDTDHLSLARVSCLSTFGPNFVKNFPGKRFVGYIGRTIESIRGFDAWIEVYLLLREVYPDLHFIVMGEDKIIQRGGGSEFYYGIPSFKKYVLDRKGLRESDLLDITWIPRLKFYDYMSLLSVLDLALYPMYGMFANWSLFQALQMGVPIVASNRAYLPEVIQPRHNGYIADPDDPDDFARCAIEVLECTKLARSLSLNAQLSIKERYSVEASTMKFAALLRQLGLTVDERE